MFVSLESDNVSGFSETLSFPMFNHEEKRAFELSICTNSGHSINIGISLGNAKEHGVVILKYLSLSHDIVIVTLIGLD
jgi:hypothetical protein